MTAKVTVESPNKTISFIPKKKKKDRKGNLGQQPKHRRILQPIIFEDVWTAFFPFPLFFFLTGEAV